MFIFMTAALLNCPTESFVSQEDPNVPKEDTSKASKA